jgi:hypothetical protein
MHFDRRTFAVTAVLFGCTLAGCGGSSSHSIPLSGRLEHVPGSSVGKIVLTQLGAQRIGLQTAAARGAGPSVVIPYPAIVYDPSGQTYAFMNVAPLTYVEVPITVDHISGDTAYLLKGPAPGSNVVSVGAEELYGVQTGVLAQT